jgi:hypothetical protein
LLLVWLILISFFSSFFFCSSSLNRHHQHVRYGSIDLFCFHLHVFFFSPSFIAKSYFCSFLPLSSPDWDDGDNGGEQPQDGGGDDWGDDSGKTKKSGGDEEHGGDDWGDDSGKTKKSGGDDGGWDNHETGNTEEHHEELTVEMKINNAFFEAEDMRKSSPVDALSKFLEVLSLADSQSDIGDDEARVK